MKIIIECNVDPVPDKVMDQVKMQLQDRNGGWKIWGPAFGGQHN